MATTQFLHLNKPTGSDLVNPLTDTFPNWDLVDTAYHELDSRAIGHATELVSQGVHAITRVDQYAKTFKFIATANYEAGETFTVDGIQVNAYTPTGSALASNSYVSGAVVIASLNADDSAITIYVSGQQTVDNSLRLGGQLPSYYATQLEVDGIDTDVTNLKNLTGNTSIVGIGDGTTTGAISSLNADLNNSIILDVTIDTTKITPNTADYFKKISNLVYVQLSGAIIAPLNAFVPHQLGTINTYKPIQDLLAPVVFATGATGALLINTSGQISVVPNGNIQSGDTMYCQAFYLLK